MEDWPEVDALIADRKEVLAVAAIYRSLGCPLPEAYRLFAERCEKLAGERADDGPRS